MKALNTSATLVLVIAIGTALGWKVFHTTLTEQPRTSASPTGTRQAFQNTGTRFDLSQLPRALELPLIQAPLQPGDLAPDFALPDQNGQFHRLSQLRGQTVVLSFYPRDLTFSCVSEAVSFDSSLPALALRGARVFSVSVQNVASKAVFAKRYDISYPLLADTSKKTARDYHVLSQDGVAGRVTFVIGPDGRIQWTDQKVHAQTHATEVLAFLDSRVVKPQPVTPRQVPQRFALNSVGRGF